MSSGKRSRQIVPVSPPSIPAGNERTASQFFLNHGRMPFITDERKPWTYEGWLLLLVQMLDFEPGMPGRWPYYLRIIEEQSLPDEMIPQVWFDAGGSSSRGFKLAEKCLQIIERDGYASSSIREFLWWLGFGLGVSKERSKLKDRAQEELYRTFNAEVWLREPADYFGDLICEYKGKGWRNGTGFYPTPHALCEVLTRMALGEPTLQHRAQKFHEPCIGTGRMALHASNYTLRICGQDVDDLVIMACKVNGALFAPWLAFPLPESLFSESPPEEAITMPTITEGMLQGMLFDLGGPNVNATSAIRSQPGESKANPGKAAPKRKPKERAQGAESLLVFEEGERGTQGRICVSSP